MWFLWWFKCGFYGGLSVVFMVVTLDECPDTSVIIDVVKMSNQHEHDVRRQT